MDKLKLIIRREFNAKVRNKSFIIMTLLAPFLMVGLMFVIVYLGKANDSKQKTIAYVDLANLLKDNKFEDSESVKYEDLTKVGIENAKKQTDNENYYGLLIIPKKDSLELLANNIQFFSQKTPNMEMVNILEKKIENNLRTKKLQYLGVNVERINSARIKSEIKLSNFSGEKSSKFINKIKIGFGFFAGYMIMMFIIVYGTSVMRSVIEEKTSRIIEVIISSVKPFQLMMGKIIGNAFAGLTQFAIWGVLIVILLFIGSMIFGIDMSEMQANSSVTSNQMEMVKEMTTENNLQMLMREVWSLPWTTMLVSFVLFFLCGYLLYSGLYAAIGAAVDSETDTQQFMMPVMLPLMLGIYVGFVTVMNDPHGLVATIFSFIPFTSPIVMLMRIPFGVPLWQIALSLGLLIATFLFIVFMAAKIYRVGILMYGKKPSYKELYKWLRYKG